MVHDSWLLDVTGPWSTSFRPGGGRARAAPICPTTVAGRWLYHPKSARTGFMIVTDTYNTWWNSLVHLNDKIYITGCLYIVNFPPWSQLSEGDESTCCFVLFRFRLSLFTQVLRFFTPDYYTKICTVIDWTRILAQRWNGTNIQSLKLCVYYFQRDLFLVRV